MRKNFERGKTMTLDGVKRVGNEELLRQQQLKTEAKEETVNSVFTENPITTTHVVPQQKKIHKWNDEEKAAIEKNIHDLQSLDKKVRKQAENNLIELYGKAKMYEKPELSFKQFKKEVKQDVKNAEARSKVIATTVYKPEDKDIAKAEKKEFKTEKKAGIATHKEYHNTYNKKDYRVITSDRNQDKFFDENGELSKDETVQTIVNETGTDYRLTKNKCNNEEQNLADELGTSKKRAKSIAKTNNFETYNNGNKVLYVAACTATGGAIGSAVGALTKATATSTAEAAAVAEVADHTGAIVASDVAIASSTARAVARGTLSGLGIGSAVGLGYGLATMNKLGHDNKRDNAAKINDLRYQDDNVIEIPITEVPEGRGLVIEDIVEPDECELTPGQETETKTPEPLYKYQLKYGESPYDLAIAKYGVTGKEALQIARELKRINGVQNLNKTELPKNAEFTLPDKLKVGDKEYDLNRDTKVVGTVKEFVETKYKGSYIDKRTGETVTKYFFTDCNGKKSGPFTTAKQRDAAMAAEKANRN